MNKEDIKKYHREYTLRHPEKIAEWSNNQIEREFQDVVENYDPVKYGAYAEEED